MTTKKFSETYIKICGTMATSALGKPSDDRIAVFIYARSCLFYIGTVDTDIRSRSNDGKRMKAELRKMLTMNLSAFSDTLSVRSWPVYCAIQPMYL